MNDLALSVQVDLAQVLGMVAFAASLLVWRVSSASNTLRRMGWEGDWITSGLAYANQYRAFLIRLAQVFAEAVALIIIIWMVAFPLRQYLGRIGELTSLFSAYDSGVFHRVWADAERLKDDIVTWTVVASLLFIFGWLASVTAGFTERRFEWESYPFRLHARVVGGRWREAPAAMWQRRDEWVRSRMREEWDPGHWRRTWESWATLVAKYNELVFTESPDPIARKRAHGGGAGGGQRD